MDKEKVFDIVIGKENNKMFVWIGTEDASGAEYVINSMSEIGKVIQKYFDNYYPDLLEKS